MPLESERAGKRGLVAFRGGRLHAARPELFQCCTACRSCSWLSTPLPCNSLPERCCQSRKHPRVLFSSSLSLSQARPVQRHVHRGPPPPVTRAQQSTHSWEFPLNYTDLPSHSHQLLLASPFSLVIILRKLINKTLISMGSGGWENSNTTCLS